MTAVFFIRFSESFLPAQGRIFSKNKSPCMKSVLCTRNPTNWGLGRTMWRLRYLVMLSTMSSRGASPPSLPLPSPTPSPSALVMRPYWIQYSPSAQKKCIQLSFKIVKEMNQWSISGIFNYYSLRCTGTMMAAVSLMAVYQTSKRATLHSHSLN